VRDCLKHEVRMNLTTNGTIVSDEWLPDLVQAAAVVGFSMEGMEEQYELIRGASWTRFLHNCQRYVEARARTGSTVRLEWRFCAHADNIHQLPLLIRKAKEIGINRIKVMSLIPFVPSQKYKQLSYHRSLANRYFAESKAVADEVGIDVNVPALMDTGTWELPQADAAPAVVALKRCYFPWQMCSINELGDVRPCDVYWRSMGSIRSGSFARVWNGWRYQRLRRNVNRHTCDLCRSCRMPRFGQGGMGDWQSKPGLKEVARSLLTGWRRPGTSYVGAVTEPPDV